jgi:hypothetical protein
MTQASKQKRFSLAVPSSDVSNHRLSCNLSPTFDNNVWVDYHVPFEEEAPLLLKYKGSVLPSTLPLVLYYSLYATAIVVLHRVFLVPLAQSAQLIPVLTIVLGLLIAFRTNLSCNFFHIFPLLNDS